MIIISTKHGKERPRAFVYLLPSIIKVHWYSHAVADLDAAMFPNWTCIVIHSSMNNNIMPFIGREITVIASTTYQYNTEFSAAVKCPLQTFVFQPIPYLLKRQHFDGNHLDE